MLADRYRESHAVRNDSQLYDYVQALKERHMRKSAPLGKVIYDSKLQVMKHAFGTHTAISRVQGHRLKASREVRIASVFRDAPAAFLKMIVVHERAQQLLETTDLPVERIATEVGFGTALSLRQNFSEQFGTTPSEYRRAFSGRPFAA